MPQSPDPVDGRLAPVLAGATAWQTLSAIVVQGTFAAVTFVVAGLVQPRDFAVWGVAAIVLNAQYLVRLGLGQALIAVVERERLQEATDNTFALTSALALALGAVVFALAPQLADEFGRGFDHHDLVLALRAVSVALVFSTLESVPVALIERSLAFKERAVAEIATTVTYGVLAAGLLLTGAGVWSLIASRVILSVLRFVAFSFVAPLRPRLRTRLDVGLARRLLAYGLPLGVAGVLGFVTTNLDTALVGRAAGAGALGAYSLAFAVATLLPMFLANTIVRVSFAIYASLARDGSSSVVGAFSAGLYAQVVALLPTTLGLAAFGGPALTEVFGDRWSLSAHLLPILALYGAAQAMGTALTSFLAAAGRPRPQFVGQVASLVISLCLAIPLFRFGATGITWAFTAGQCAYFGVGLVSAVSIWPAGFLRQLFIPATAAGGAVLVGAISILLIPDSANGTSAVVVFAAVYIVLLLALDRRARALLLEVLSLSR